MTLVAEAAPAAPAPALTRDRPIGLGPRRPWRWRLLVVASLVLWTIALRALRVALWDGGRRADAWWEDIASYGSILWAVPVLPAAMTVAGMLLWRGPLRREPPAVDAARLDGVMPTVCFRICSRGTNPGALAGTVAAVRDEMARRPLFPYRIEVVTDVPVELPPGPDLDHLVVPAGYQTPRGARFKARALHHAVERSSLADDGWIMHLDEESRPSPELLVGIHDFIVESHDHPDRNIGQGVIRYDRFTTRHPFLTLADSIRTGDDVGRYHLQHRLGFTVFGLHGSFILVRNDVAKRVGFDFGPEGSITEDAFWALRQMAEGQRCRWVEGDLLEQSTQSVADFVKQRRRWFAGMVKVVLYADVQAWIRVPLAAFTVLWSLAWASMLFTMLNLVLGLRTPAPSALAGDVGYAAHLTTYVLGLHLNLRHHPELRRWSRAWRYVVQVVGMPVFALMEAAGVLLAVARPERGFHVVHKDVDEVS